MNKQEKQVFGQMKDALEQSLRGMSAAIFGTDTYKVSSRGDFASKVEKQIKEALAAANALGERVGINGLTEAETNASMSVMGLSKPKKPTSYERKCFNDWKNP